MRQLDCFLRALSECSTENFTFTSVYEVRKGSMFIFLPTILCKKRTVDLDKKWGGILILVYLKIYICHFTNYINIFRYIFMYNSYN